MRVVRLGLAAAAGLAALALSAAPGDASVTRYFYDATGRMVGTTTEGTQDKGYQFDAADNRTVIQLEPQVGSSTGYSLTSGQSLLEGQALTSSQGHYVLVLQEDGNLVFYGPGGSIVWATGTNQTTADYLVMQPDGNLVLYDAQRNALWKTNTANHPGAFFQVQEDGNMAVYPQSGTTAICGVVSGSPSCPL